MGVLILWIIRTNGRLSTREGTYPQINGSYPQKDVTHRPSACSACPKCSLSFCLSVQTGCLLQVCGGFHPIRERQLVQIDFDFINELV